MITTKDFGLIDYQSCLDLQHQFVEQKKEIIMTCEHPVVITLGRGKESREDVLNRDVHAVEVERGGRATLHLPGQVVIYPIMNVVKRGLDALKILRSLENSIVQTLADFRITSAVVEGKTGVWVDEGQRKIASIGIAIKNEMSFHGLSLNVACDLKEFKNLKPCGFESSVMTSMKMEIPEKYWQTWKLTDESLMWRVKLRLVENLLEEFDA
jgi:lipoyl(octanoyl) transferase